MKKYTVLSHDGYRTVTSVIHAASDEEAIAVVSDFFRSAAIELSENGRLVKVFAEAPDQSLGRSRSFSANSRLSAISL